MSNRELSIILRLRDEATKRLEGVKGALHKFANTWKRNWLAITAAITASIIALKKAWDLMEMGAKAKQIEDSFRAMAESVGISADKMKEAMMEASAGTVNFSNVADKAAALMAQGLNMDTVVALMKQARVEARIFGSTTEEAFQNISSAVTGGLVTTLRRTYGLNLSLKEAAEEYAKATGKSTEQVQKHYMAQALANHILSQSKSHLEAVNLEMLTNYERVQMIKSRWNDLLETIGQALWKVLGFIQGVLTYLTSGFFKLLEVGTLVFQKLLIPLQKFYELMGKLPGKVGEVYRAQADEIDRLSKKLEENKEIFKLASEESAQDALKQFDLIFAKAKETADQTGNVLKDAANNMSEAVEEIKTKFNAVQEFVKGTARNMESAFSELFFRVFTNDLKDIKEVFADFGKMMLRTIAEIIAKLIVMRMFMALAGPSGSIFGVPLGNIFHAGGMIQNRRLQFVKAHSGLSPDEVPIIAQTGEGVLSRRGVNTLGGPENLRALNRGEGIGGNSVTININQVIQAWSAEDVWRNRRMLSEAIADDIYSNGKIRSVIRNLT